MCLFMTDKTDPMTYDRQRTNLGEVPIISRTIPISIDIDSPKLSNITLEITIWEMEKPSEIIQTWWSVQQSDRAAMGDPFGVVMWPGSIVASQELMKLHYCSSPSQIQNSTVLVLGAGTGVEAQTAALLGARKVIATDINQLTLKLIDFTGDQVGKKNSLLQSIIQTKCKYCIT